MVLIENFRDGLGAKSAMITRGFVDFMEPVTYTDATQAPRTRRWPR